MDSDVPYPVDDRTFVYSVTDAAGNFKAPNARSIRDYFENAAMLDVDGTYVDKTRWGQTVGRITRSADGTQITYAFTT